MLLISDWAVLFPKREKKKKKRQAEEKNGKVLNLTCNIKSELRKNSVLRASMRVVDTPQKSKELHQQGKFKRT